MYYVIVKIKLNDSESAFIADIVQVEEGICSKSIEHVPLPPLDSMRIYTASEIDGMYPDLEPEG